MPAKRIWYYILRHFGWHCLYRSVLVVKHRYGYFLFCGFLLWNFIQNQSAQLNILALCVLFSTACIAYIIHQCLFCYFLSIISFPWPFTFHCMTISVTVHEHWGLWTRSFYCTFPLLSKTDVYLLDKFGKMWFVCIFVFLLWFTQKNLCFCFSDLSNSCSCWFIECCRHF